MLVNFRTPSFLSCFESRDNRKPIFFCLVANAQLNTYKRFVLFSLTQAS